MAIKLRSIPEVSSISEENEIILPIFNEQYGGITKKISVIKIIEYIKERVLEDGEISVEPCGTGFRFKYKEKS